MLTQLKPSTQTTLRSHLRKHLIPSLGNKQLRDIGPEEVQRFISPLSVGPKTKKNIFATFQMVWKTARAWGYVERAVLHNFLNDLQNLGLFIRSAPCYMCVMAEYQPGHLLTGT